ncbi:hypothetical protein [Paraburkholderia sp. BL27I4N3]|uniref:hypothetical protein n=1 Tax=Paraburkholderia sp. BL27I4N3 TaxID=1938805 RepID=UPI0021625610|nr:hypothetical protein [Paraburkholderia sp. BL27I4N3]
MAFIDQRIEDGGPIHARALADRLETELGISVHPRSIERAIARKKTVELAAARDAIAQAPVAAYEALRTAVIDGSLVQRALRRCVTKACSTGFPCSLKQRRLGTLSTGHEPVAHLLQPNGALVRLLTNLVLRTHSGLVHVY